MTDLTPDQRAAQIAEIRRRLAAITTTPWEAKPHTHGASGCRCLSCDDPPVGWVVDHPGALDCNELVGARSYAGELNDFNRPLDSCEDGPLLTYEDADFAARAPEYVALLLAEIDRLNAPAEHCIHDAAIHHRRHDPATPVDGCPWCTDAGTRVDEVPTGGLT